MPGHRLRGPCRGAAAVIAVGLLVSGWVGGGAAADLAAQRHVRDGALHIIDVAGRPAAMGYQRATALGGTARATLDNHVEQFRAAAGSSWLAREGWPRTLTALNALVDPTGFYGELAGMAQALGVPRHRVWQAAVGALAGSTAVAARPAATAGESALLARNVDLPDGGGWLPPVVTRYAPANGQRFMMASWPLMPVPVVGLNASGVAISLNHFPVENAVARRPAVAAYRLALEEAASAEEAAELIARQGARAGAALVLVTDDDGTVIQMDCRVAGCRRQTVQAPVFALSNHPLHPDMAAEVGGPSLDSRQRRQAATAAARERAGALDPAGMAAILRDRRPSSVANDHVVANAMVLGSIVVDPAARVMWHGTGAQPLQPFARLRAIPLRPETDAPDDLAAAADFAERRTHEAPTLRRFSRAVSHVAGGDGAAAEAILAELSGSPWLHPARLAWVRAVAAVQRGDFAGARDHLARIDGLATMAPETVPTAVGIYARLMRGALAVRAGNDAAVSAAVSAARQALASVPGGAEAVGGVVAAAQELADKLASEGLAAQRSWPLLARVPAWSAPSGLAAAY